MSDEKDLVTEATTEVTAPAPQEQPKEEKKIEPRLALEPKTPKSVGSLLREGFKKSKEQEDAPLPLTSRERREAAKSKDQQPEQAPPAEKKLEAKSSEAKAPENDADKEDSKATTEAAPEKTQQPSSGIAAPAALSKEVKALWDTLPEQIQKEFVRRESDTQKGVEQLKAKYQPIEEVLAPVRPLLQQNGLTEAHAVKQLFDWHKALASPNKAHQVAAFRALAQSHNVDLNAVAPQQQTQTNQPQPTPQIDPLKQIDDLLQARLDARLQPVSEQLNFYQAELQRQKLEAANNELSAFARDKPHFENVRTQMAEILTIAAQNNRPVTLQEAYDQAVWSNPDIRAGFLQEQDAKREAEFKAAQELAVQKAQQAESERLKKIAEEETKRKEAEALEKARRASISIRSTTPVGSMPTNNGPKRPQSVADTIRAAVKDVRATAI